MDRGLRSQLSPNEESTLRLLSMVGHDQALMRLSDLARLKALRLIEVREGGLWALTEIGVQRLAVVPARR
jgi:hypothetical protein